MNQPRKFQSIDEAGRWVLEQLPSEVHLAAPLGLGKPNVLLNWIYDQIKQDPKRKLNIYTALSLQIPKAHSFLESRFLKPFVARHFGENYPEFHYVRDAQIGQLPERIHVHEFYLQAGQSLHNPFTQKSYVSLNYTHVAQALVERGLNVLVQMVARDSKQTGRLSLSCNPDLTLDLFDLYKANHKPLIKVAVVHPDLPFTIGDALVTEDFFDVIIEDPSVNHQLFALPRNLIKTSDYMIGLYASLLVEDGGTLQIGIGSLSDALVYWLCLRQSNNKLYCEIVEALLKERPQLMMHEQFHTTIFKEGLYATSEMVMDGFMHLIRAGIVKRTVRDQYDSHPRFLHGAFFLGSKEFYKWLRELHANGETGLSMTRVSRVNDLYDKDELSLRRQRVKARFFNSTMKVTLLGAANSDSDDQGDVVSGVGGQYNFVAMAHEMPDAFSVLLAKSRHKGQPNILWSIEHTTIPRHLRDVVVTEYGLAFLKNRSDEECIRAMIAIADQEDQSALEDKAVAALKWVKDSPRPKWSAQNSAEWNKKFLKRWKDKGIAPDFPFGSDFDATELKLLKALKHLEAKSQNPLSMLGLLIKGSPRPEFEVALARMNLDQPSSFTEHFWRRLVSGALSVIQ